MIETATLSGYPYGWPIFLGIMILGIGLSVIAIATANGYARRWTDRNLKPYNGPAFVPGVLLILATLFAAPGVSTTLGIGHDYDQRIAALRALSVQNIEMTEENRFVGSYEGAYVEGFFSPIGGEEWYITTLDSNQKSVDLG